MSAQPLPDRPNLDQLKRQAKELLAEWRSNAAAGAPEPRLRDAQRAIAQRYGFDSWDALRERVTQAGATRPRRGMDYDDPVPDVVELSGPLTREAAARLAERGVTGVKPASSVDRGSLAHLIDVATLRRLDLSGRDDLVDDDLAFLAAMPSLTAISLASCGGISDRGVAHLHAHQGLEQINLQWTATGDGAVAALATFGALRGVLALDLHMSVFGSPHYTARGVAHLAGMTSLEELNFHGPLATDEVLGEIARIPALRHLHCQDPISGEDGFVALAQGITLEVLSGRVCPRMTSRGFAALARLTRLRSLGLGGPLVGDEAMAAFAGAPSLADLGPIMFGDAAFVHTWGEDASGMRTRIGIGLRERSLFVRSFKVEPLGS